MISQTTTPTEAASQTDCDSSQCPLCGRSNDCQLCTLAAYKGPCWCVSAKIPDELLARISPESRNKACICAGCVAAFHGRQIDIPLPLLPGDYYFNETGLIVLTAAYLERRGYCCGSGCHHCPYNR